MLSLSEPPPPDVYSYVADYWQEHSKSWKETMGLADPIERFLFDPASPHSWNRYTESRNSRDGTFWLPSLKPRPIHLICYFNLIAVLRYFFQRRLQDLETPEVLSEALALAAGSECNEVVEFLLREYPQVGLEIAGKIPDPELMTRRIHAKKKLV